MRNYRAPFVAPVRAMNLLWIVIVGVAFAAAQLWGTPHLRVSYQWNGRDASPYYHACRYWGWASFRYEPGNGRCPLLMFAFSKKER